MEQSLFADPCNPNPCQNDGTCSDGACTCPEGWTGDNCEVEGMQGQQDVM